MNKIFAQKTFGLPILALFFVLTACKGPNPNPELSDPIYLDLVSEKKTADSAITALEKELEGIQKEIAAFGPRDPTRRHKVGEFHTKEKTLVQLRQKMEYFEVRQKQRKEYAQIEYLKRYEAGLPWPDPAEVAAYKKVKELQSASRNWGDRVPKTTRYQKSTDAEAAAKKK